MRKALLLLAVIIGLPFALHAAPPEYIWVESESPTAEPQIKPDAKDAANKGFDYNLPGPAEWLSGGKTITISVDAATVKDRAPEGGIITAYDFDAKSAGKFELWNRIGLEWVRSNFDWRLNGGEWKTLANTEPTTDMVPLGVWTEIAWIKLGDVDLKAGKNKLEIRLVPGADKDGKPTRILYRSDCFCLSKGPFRPNFLWKPDDLGWQSENVKKAAQQVFDVKLADKPGDRSEISLGGLWQIARWDEQGAIPDASRMVIPDALPNLDELFWYAYSVPGNRNEQLKDWGFAHRYLVRTKLKVPAEAKGRSFLLDIQDFNMVAGVFVNGVKCDWSKAYDAQWLCDITAGVKPGEANDLVIVFKDAYYAFPGTEPLGTRAKFNIPVSWLSIGHVSNGMDSPVAYDTRTGLKEPVSLIVAGQAYAQDVFCKPSVKDKKMSLEVTLKNPSKAEVTATVDADIVPWNKGEGGASEKTFKPLQVALKAGEEKVVELSEPWANPKLWWPSSPNLYWAVTKVTIGNQVVDIKKTRFGFRDIDWHSADFRLNGVKWQFWANTSAAPTLEEAVKLWKQVGQNIWRFWTPGGYRNKTKRETLDYSDEAGMLLRRSGVFDGEAGNYALLRDGQPDAAFIKNWVTQLKGWIKAERNHPALFIWSFENEVVYINSMNWGRGDKWEPVTTQVWNEIKVLDPTRPFMVDGGRALKDESLEVNGCHYEEGSTGLRVPGDYPDAAYTLEPWYSNVQRGRWPMKKNAPIFLGENFYANGYTLPQLAPFGGEQTFVGRSDAEDAIANFARMLYEGNRWAGVAAHHCWFALANEPSRAYVPGWSAVAVLCRQWNWTFNDGTEIARTLRVFNNTELSDPIDMAWELRAGDKVVDQGKKTFNVPAGEAETTEIKFKTPKVDARTEGTFVVTATRGGKEVFRQVHKTAYIKTDAVAMPKLGKADLYVVDPQGAVKKRLTARKMEFTEATDLQKIPPTAKLLIVGKDAIPENLQSDSLWMRIVAGGTKLLVLEQKYPLKNQAVPADFESTELEGRIGFSEDLTHPVMDGLQQPDFYTWSKDHILYRGAYRKATKGARSLVQCDEQLGYSALVECQVDDSSMILSQLVMGEKLDADPVAQRLFDNSVSYLSSYKAVRKATVAVLPADDLRAKLLKDLDLSFKEVSDPVAAISGSELVAVIDASPANLKALAGALDKVKAYMAKGGSIMFWGLTPEGLDDYNKIVGFNHIIRPFAQERVVLSTPRDPMTAGLTLRDVVMEDTESIFPWMSAKWTVDDEFTYVVDYTDVGPFSKLPPPEEMGIAPGLPYTVKARKDHNPGNLFNNFTKDDAWVYAYMIVREKGEKDKFTLEFPREEEVSNFSIKVNTTYNIITKINLFFDNDPTPFVLTLSPTDERQDCAVQGKKAKKIRLEVVETQSNNANSTADVIGIDNIWIGVKRSEEFMKHVKPLVNIGALVRYNLDKGVIVLNQLKINPSEKNPVNGEKKGSIAKTLLRNLGATFAGGSTVIVGMNINYTPIKWQEGLSNAFLGKTEKQGWFDKGDISAMPIGPQTFGGVKYDVPYFQTSPVPVAIMLKGQGSTSDKTEVKGIQIDKTADALFFLHAGRLTDASKKWLDDKDKGKEKGERPTLFKYVINYADGKSVEIPIQAGKEIDNWKQKKFESLPGASIAWTLKPEGGTDEIGVYSMQWNNPRPAVAIKSIDMVQGPDKEKWGTGALLGVTAGTTQKK